MPSTGEMVFGVMKEIPLIWWSSKFNDRYVGYPLAEGRWLRFFFYREWGSRMSSRVAPIHLQEPRWMVKTHIWAVLTSSEDDPIFLPSILLAILILYWRASSLTKSTATVLTSTPNSSVSSLATSSSLDWVLKRRTLFYKPFTAK